MPTVNNNNKHNLLACIDLSCQLQDMGVLSFANTVPVKFVNKYDQCYICSQVYIMLCCSGRFRGGSKGSMEPPFWLQ